MRAERAKQRLKNGVYRTIGETTATLAPANGDSDRRLRVLMYHKVNDLPGNPLSVPVGVFDEQMAQLRELAYTVVALDDVLEYYANAAELPSRSVLITFDDGYRDNLEHAAPVLERYGYPAVLFVPIAYLDDALPLPHEERLAARGVVNSTLDWGELAELEALDSGGTIKKGTVAAVRFQIEGMVNGKPVIVVKSIWPLKMPASVITACSPETFGLTAMSA